jgi:hypothetical protein
MPKKKQSIYKLFTGEKENENSKLDALLKVPIRDKPVNTPQIQVPKENAIHQIDLLYLPIDPSKNRYCLVAVDLATGKMDAEPIKDRDSVAVANAMKNIYKRKILSAPYIIEVDDGSEFKGSFPAEMKKLGVNHMRTKKAGRSRQQAKVEGMNYVLGRLLQRQMLAEEMLTGERSTEWVDDLPRAVKLINEHMSHKPLTFDGPPRCEGNSCNVLEEGTHVRVIYDKPMDYVTGERLHGKFRAGDVRFDPTDRVIEQIIIKPDQPPMYLVSGIPNVAYTKNQLQVIKKDEILAPTKHQKKFVAEKIVGKKTIKKKVHYEVQWEGSQENTWEPRSTLIKQIPKLIQEFENKLKLK